MKSSPITAPKAQEDFSKKIVNQKKFNKEQEAGGVEYSSWNAHSQYSGSPLPCGCYERVKYHPNRPECHLWNTPQCGYGCGTCAGSDACLNYPFSHGASDTFYPGAPGPICKMALGNNKNQSGGNAAWKEQLQGKNCGNNPNLVPSSITSYYSQQCACAGVDGGDCAGSGTMYGCVTCCEDACQKGGSKNNCRAGGGNGCKDCDYYYRKNQVYRHMLKGSLYPFCQQ